MRFTGHERDLKNPANATDDLDYMHARYYNPNLARFISVDPVGGKPSVPQSWNGYSYTWNNPIRGVDPDGEATLWDIADVGFAIKSIGNLWVKALNGKPLTWQDNFDAITDAAGLLPGLPGSGSAREGARLAGSTIDAIRHSRGAAADLISTHGVQDRGLSNILNNLFRSADTIPGGTAGAVRAELASYGTKAVGGRSHVRKALNEYRGLGKRIASGNLTASEEALARAVQRDLADALSPLMKELKTTPDELLNVMIRSEHLGR